MASSPSGVSRQLLASGQGDGRMFAWAKQVENLDMKEVELQASQMKILRDQVTALVQELTSVRQELATVKMKQADFDSGVGLTVAVPGSMMARLTMLENTAESLPHIHDNVNKDMEGLRQGLDKINKAIEDAKLAATNQVASATKRVENVENAMNSGFDRDWRELQDLKIASTEHGGWISQMTKDLAHYRSSTEESLNSLEKLTTDTFAKHSADLIGMKQVDEKHNREISEVKGLLQPIECKLSSQADQFGEVYEKHFKDVGAIRDTMAKHSLAHSKVEKEIEQLKGAHLRFGTVNDQIAAIEDSITEMSASYMRDLKDLHGSHDKHSDRIAKDVQLLRSTVVDIDARVASLDRQVANAADMSQTDIALLKESKDKMTNDFTVLGLEQKKMLTHIDKLLLFEKNAEYANSRSLTELGSLRETCETHASDVDRRFDAVNGHVKLVEKSVADLCYKEAKDVQTLRGSLDKHIQDYLQGTEDVEVKRNELMTMISHLEARSTGAQEKASSDIVHLKDKQHKLNCDLALLQSEDEANIQKLAVVEQDIQSERLKRENDFNLLKASLTKHAEAEGRNLKEIKLLGETHHTLNELVHSLETCLKDTNDIQSQEVAELKSVQSVVARDVLSIKNVTSKINADALANVSDQAGIKDRLQSLENRLRQCFNVP